MVRIGGALLLLATCVLADEARWIRYPAISPDGRWIAFSYAGDIWRVSVDGGAATPVTTHIGHEKQPVWSPDGRWIAFASDRHGNYDVFLVPAEGGPARRLTFHSSTDAPTGFTRDGKEVLFSATRLDAPEANVGSAWFSELYAVSIDGGRPRQLLTTPALHARPSPDGTKIVYEDFKGWENAWRKHHVSAVTRDIWVFDLASGKHTKLTTWRGEDREPVWTKQGIAFLSERSGSFNVYRLAEPPVALTKHKPFPVRFLSAADDGTLCYACNGVIWVQRPGEESRRLRVTVRTGAKENAVRAMTLRSGATKMAVSPNGQEVAFVVRGEVFVASRQARDDPAHHGARRSQERSVDVGQGRPLALLRGRARRAPGTCTEPISCARRRSSSSSRRC